MGTAAPRTADGEVATGERFGNTVARAREDTGEGATAVAGAERRRGQDSDQGRGSAPATEQKQREQRVCRGRRRGKENQGLI
jgi:hypothetical protein